jgi:hypothetical protein
MKKELKKRLSIMREVKQAIRQPYAWPGGYPISIICNDGGILCPACARDNFRGIAHDTVKGWRTGWDIAAVDVLWEGGNYCNQCSNCVDAYTEQ